MRERSYGVLVGSVPVRQPPLQPVFPPVYILIHPYHSLFPLHATLSLPSLFSFTLHLLTHAQVSMGLVLPIVYVNVCQHDRT
jgi:hypothetical protein